MIGSRPSSRAEQRKRTGRGMFSSHVGLDATRPARKHVRDQCRHRIRLIGPDIKHRDSVRRQRIRQPLQQRADDRQAVDASVERCRSVSSMRSRKVPLRLRA